MIHSGIKKGLFLSLGICCAFNVHAGGIALYEIGSDDVGLAAAGYSARAQDPSTIYTNPAGMTRLHGKQFFIGAQVLYEDIEFSLTTVSPFLGTNNGGNPIDAVPGGSFFYSHSISDDFKIGLGFYGNFGSMFKYDGDWVGRYHTVKGTLTGLSLQPTLAYRISEGFSFGGGPIFMYGIFRTKTRINNTPFQITNFHDGELKLSDYHWGIGANLGALYEFNECTRIGLSYISPIKLNFSPDAVFTDLSPLLTTVLGNNRLLNSQVDIGIEVPQQAMASIFHQISKQWALLASLGWQNWKKFGQMEIGINSTNPINLTVDSHYNDTWHGALGGQYQWSKCILLNFGVGYDDKFQGTTNIPLNVPANSAWRFGIGSRFTIKRTLDLGTAFEFIHGGTLHVNGHSVVKGDIVGEFKNVNVYLLALNANFKST